MFFLESHILALFTFSFAIYCLIAECECDSVGFGMQSHRETEGVDKKKDNHQPRAVLANFDLKKKIN